MVEYIVPIRVFPLQKKTLDKSMLGVPKIPSKDLREYIVDTQLVALSKTYNGSLNYDEVRDLLLQGFIPPKNKTLESQLVDWDHIADIGRENITKPHKRTKPSMPVKIQRSLGHYCFKINGVGKIVFTNQDLLEMFMDPRSLDIVPNYGAGTRKAVRRYLVEKEIISEDVD